MPRAHHLLINQRRTVILIKTVGAGFKGKLTCTGPILAERSLKGEPTHLLRLTSDPYGYCGVGSVFYCTIDEPFTEASRSVPVTYTY